MKLSIIIPSRNERFLLPTVRDLLAKAQGDIEIFVCLDGYWATDLPADPRIHILHRGDAVGMRDNINAAAALATGDFLLKTDAHCLWADGYDVALTSTCDGDWILTPRRYALDAENWCLDESQPRKYPVDAHYLSNPLERADDPACGLHGTIWTARREQRKHVLVDDEMSSQGSAWCMSTSWWRRTIGHMDSGLFGPFVSEYQELGLKTALAGGSVKVVKTTHYAHLFKGKKYGRGYTLGPNQFSQGPIVTDYFMNDRWPGIVPGRSLLWWVEKFWPVPGWGDDPARVFHAFKSGRVA